MNPWTSKFVGSALDLLRKYIPSCEYTFCMAVYRRTLEWNRYSEVIPYYHFIKGNPKAGFAPVFTNKNRLSEGRKAVTRGLVIQKNSGRKAEYMLNIPVLLHIYRMLFDAGFLLDQLVEVKREVRGFMKDEFLQAIAVGADEDALEEQDIEAAKAILAGKSQSASLKRAVKTAAETSEEIKAKKADKPKTLITEKKESTAFKSVFGRTLKKYHPDVIFIPRNTAKVNAMLNKMVSQLREAGADPISFAVRVAENWPVIALGCTDMRGKEAPMDERVVDLNHFCYRWGDIFRSLRAYKGDQYTKRLRVRIVSDEE